MTSELENIVQEAMELTGSPAPAVLSADAPVLEIEPAAENSLYLIGLIGGKEVGKSSLINALVGKSISEQSAHGPGTEEVIAYVHVRAAEQLRWLLERVAQVKYRIVTHTVDDLSRQVLVDLPDIDSHWAPHVALTRKMLRHLLFPLWIQSIEKYADLQPQRLLAQVAQGNDPANFVFCLNKADQLREGQAAAEELRNDYAARIKKSLSLGAPPRVYLISAQQPAMLDLPALRSMLSKQKATAIVRESRELAGNRQDRTLLDWLDQQRLPSRAEQVGRLRDEAEELLWERVGTNLLESQVLRLQNDSGYQFTILEPVVQRRLSRWPLVNVLQTLLAPLMAIVQRNLGDGATADGISVPALQSTFALLHQSHPAIGVLYNQRKLWEDLPAAQAQADLRSGLNDVIQRQAATAMERIARPTPLLMPIRWLLTVGAALWFPIVQPILQAVLSRTWSGMGGQLALLAVEVLSVAHLFKSVLFVIIYIVALWAILRWDTRRRVNRLLNRWTPVDGEAGLSLPGEAMSWLDRLLTPIQQQLSVVNQLEERLQKVRMTIGGRSKR